MNIKLVIDRFEGKYAILESQDKNPLIFNFPRHLLPEGVKEGTVIRFNINIDDKETGRGRKNKGSLIMIPSEKTLSRLKEEVYINAVRLFCDACTLYKVHAYPSSYAFAILSFEELGKLEMIDHICDDIIINPDSNPQEFLDHLFSREMLFSHVNKQVWASISFPKGINKRTKKIANRELEKNKQDAIYVGYINRRIRSPKRISAIKAYIELTITFDKFKDISDLGFNGFECWSDAQSRAKTKRYLKKIEDLFTKLNKPGKKKT